MEDKSGKPEAPTVQPVPCHATEGLTQQASIAVGRGSERRFVRPWCLKTDMLAIRDEVSISGLCSEESPVPCLREDACSVHREEGGGRKSIQ